jgi:chromosome-anchoring protein RacA
MGMLASMALMTEDIRVAPNSDGDTRGIAMMVEGTNDQWSTSEVAKELGISPSLVRTWISYMNWEVRRNAEGHRVFSNEDVEQLKQLKQWLDEGNSLKEFRRERQVEGPFDPRIELRGAFRRLKELQSQEEALISKQQELLESARQQREALHAQLASIQTQMEGGESPIPTETVVVAQPDTSHVVQSVLKQLLTAIMEKQGKLQLVRRFEEEGKQRVEYMAPTGKRQIVDDVCTSEADRRMLETVLALILNG